MTRNNPCSVGIKEVEIFLGLPRKNFSCLKHGGSPRHRLRVLLVHLVGCLQALPMDLLEDRDIIFERQIDPILC